MNISRNNYEVWFIDYYDGHLSDKAQEQMFQFLDEHPDLRSEFEQYSQIKLERSTVSFSDKKLLRKDESDIKEFNDKNLIAFLEGDLNENQRKSFDKKIQSSSELTNEYRLFQLTKLSPETKSEFEGKKSLIQPITISLYKKNSSKWLIRIAAIFLILIIGTAVILMTTQDVIPVRQTGNVNSKINLSNPIKNDKSETTSEGNEIINAAQSPQNEIIEYNDSSALQAHPKNLFTEQNQEAIPATPNYATDIDGSKENLKSRNMVLIPSSPKLIVDSDELDKSITVEPELRKTEVQKDEYLGVFGGLKTLAKKEVAKSMELDDNSRFSNELSDDNYKKVKLLDIVGLGISRASKDKVRLKTREDKNGKVTAHGMSVSAGE